MNLGDRLWIVLRHARSGAVGVLLVVLATAVGVALAASTAAFVAAYTLQTQRMLNDPAYREVEVRVVQPGSDATLDLPMVEMTDAPATSLSFTLADVQDAVAAVPATRYGYLLQPMALTFTEAVPDRGKPASGAADPGKPAGGAPDGTAVGTVQGFRTTADFFPAYGLTVAAGTFLVEDDLAAGNAQVLVLGSDLAARAFPQGDAVGARIGVAGRTATIVGVLEPSGLSLQATPLDAAAFRPEEAIIAMGRGTISDARFSVPDSGLLTAAADQLGAYFATARPDLLVQVETAADRLDEERRVLLRTLAVLAFLTAVGLLIAAINLMNLMLMRVVRRTKSIGIMRALGWSRASVFGQVFTESALICFVGAVVGAAVSPLAYRLLGSTLNVGGTTASSGGDLAIGALVGFAFTLAFAAYPAMVAGTTDTASALRAE